ncbi:MAG: aldo/keto reductase [Nitrososphaerales archaeon]
MEEALKASIRSRAINVIDTAINYKFQKSERAIGRSLQTLITAGEISMEQVFVSSKNGYLAPDTEYSRGYQHYVNDELIESNIIIRSDIVDSSHCMTVPYLGHELERSRSNLQLETIDLVYLHNSAQAQIQFIGKQEYMERVWKAFQFYEEQRRSGSIPYYGLATWDCFRNEVGMQDHLNLNDIYDVAVAVGGSDHGFRFIQFPFNLAMPEALVLRNQNLKGLGRNVIGRILHRIEHWRIHERAYDAGMSAHSSRHPQDGGLNDCSVKSPVC